MPSKGEAPTTVATLEHRALAQFRGLERAVARPPTSTGRWLAPQGPLPLVGRDRVGGRVAPTCRSLIRSDCSSGRPPVEPAEQPSRHCPIEEYDSSAYESTDHSDKVTAYQKSLWSSRLLSNSLQAEVRTHNDAYRNRYQIVAKPEQQNRFGGDPPPITAHFATSPSTESRMSPMTPSVFSSTSLFQ